MILDTFSLTHYAPNMSRNQTIDQLFAVLGKALPEQGYPELDAEKIEEIYSAIENDKEQKTLFSSELGFTIRKRSKTKVKDPDAPEKKARKTGYSCFPGESDYKEQVDQLALQLEDGKKLGKLKAKSRIWSDLSEEQKEPFNQIAADANRENGLPPPKKTSSPKEPKLTNQQLQEQLRLTQEALQQTGITDMPAPPPREVKPRKKKDSAQSSPVVGEEPVLSPPVQPEPNPVEIGSDSDSDSDTSDTSPQEVSNDDDYNHIQWTLSIVKDSGEDGPKADFIAWLMAERPSEFGPTKRNTLFNDDEVKELKKQFDFKSKKKDPSSPWYDFIKIHSSD